MTEQIRIEKIREYGERIKLWITGLEKSLIIDQVTFYENRLVEGIVLTESQLEILTKASEKMACEDSAGRMLALRNHSIGELKFKLVRKGFETELISPVINKYKMLGLLDDAVYARERVESMLRRNPSGRSHLIGMLQKRMVPRSLAEQVVNTLLQNQDETELAVQSLSRRWGLIKDLELERSRKKAYNYLSRRGISFGAAKAAFDRLHKEEFEEKEKEKEEKEN